MWRHWPRPLAGPEPTALLLHQTDETPGPTARRLAMSRPARTLGPPCLSLASGPGSMSRGRSGAPTCGPPVGARAHKQHRPQERGPKAAPDRNAGGRKQRAGRGVCLLPAPGRARRRYLQTVGHAWRRRWDRLWDEDLREGVRAVQDLGVRVTLIGIPTRGDTFNQSKELVNEADQSTMLAKSDLDKLATRIQPRRAPAHKLLVQADPVADVSAAAAKYTRQWLSRSTHEELKSMQENRPVIPRALDASLLDSIESEVGISLRRREGLRREARQTFWRLVARAGQNKSASTANTTTQHG